MPAKPDSFGRVEKDGTVLVNEGGTWRPVGSYPDGSPEEALAYFVRKFEELEAGVALAEQRLKASAPVQDLKKQVTKLAGELVAPSAVGDIEALRKRLETVAEKLPAKEAEHKENREKEVAEALGHREKIVADMEALATKNPASIRWKETSFTVTELFDAWKSHQKEGPKLPKQVADELWARFKVARTTLEKARRAHFAELDKRSKEAKTTKKGLIQQAEALADQGASGISTYRNLLEKWKAAPRASKTVEDSLWKQFKAAGDVLYQKKSEEIKADDEANRGNWEEKKALIEQFQDILTLGDHAEAAARLRAFHTQFQKLGPVPKKNVKDVEGALKRFEQHLKTLEEKKWRDNNPEKKARSQSMADQLKDSISKLEIEIEGASSRKKEDLKAELETKRAWLAVLDN
jgi:hypothetical protein